MPAKIPLYLRVADDLRGQIVDGTLPAGSRLPSRVGLAGRFHVSENVVRRAIDVLMAEGFVETRAGTRPVVRGSERREKKAPDTGSHAERGTTSSVRRRIMRGSLVKRNTRHVGADGGRAVGGYSFPAASGGELWIHHVPPTVSEEPIGDRRLAELLRVPRGSMVLRRRRVTGPPGEPPFQMSESWIHPRGVADAPAVAEPLGTGPGAWIDQLEEAGHGPLEWVEFHRARSPEAAEAALLQIPVGLPVQEIVRVGYSAKDERAIEVTRVVIPSDRVEEVVHLKRDASAAWPHRDAGPDGPHIAP